MIDFNKDYDPDEIEQIKREKELEQEEYIRNQFSNFENGNGKSNNNKKKKDSNNPIIITSEKEIEKSRILNQIQKLRQENSELTFEQWSDILKVKHQILVNKIEEHFPKIAFKVLLELDFVLSLKTILNIDDITLPFLGIVFAAPSSMKTQLIELFEKWIYSYYTDKFTAKSFVSHSAIVAKDKLGEVDLLPRIKNKILLTPELSPLFTGKEEDIKEQFGIITKVLDGKGYKSESGVHGQRGYHGEYMFSWIGAAVDIPHNIYKFLSTIGFKIYFLRLPRTEVTTDDLADQLLTEKPFGEKMNEIEKSLLEYLIWFELCPLSIGLQNLVKIEWDKSKENRNLIKIIAELAILLSHLRGNVVTYKSSNIEDFIPSSSSDENNNNNNNSSSTTTNYHVTEFIHGIPTIEDPSRAVQQLYNLARGHALSYGRNFITMDDISLVLKVVLSTGSIERVLILDLLIAHQGELTTSQITTAMRISNSTAKRTMTEFKGLELVTMERTNENASNSEYKITLNPKFKWFLTEDFSKLRDGFKPTDNKEFLKPKSNTDNNEGFAATILPPVLDETQDQQSQQEDPLSKSTTNTEIETNTNDNNDDPLHRGENARSKIAEALEPKSLLFNNALISESDLNDPTGFQYDPEIINNIDRFGNTGTWYCKKTKCNVRGDRWHLMKHDCKYRNIKSAEEAS
jgi:predicted transcriptional regulator